MDHLERIKNTPPTEKTTGSDKLTLLLFASAFTPVLFIGPSWVAVPAVIICLGYNIMGKEAARGGWQNLTLALVATVASNIAFAALMQAR